MAKKTVVKTGFLLLDRKLKKLTSKEQKAAFRKSARPAMKPLQQEARSNAKQDKVTGTTGKAIKIRSIKRSRSRIGIRVTSGATSFSGKFYHKFQELGWKAGKARKKQKGNQPMKRAAKTKRRAVARIYKQNLKQNIRDLTR